MRLSSQSDPKQEKLEQVPGPLPISVLVQIYREATEFYLVGSPGHESGWDVVVQEGQSPHTKDAEFHKEYHLLLELRGD